MKIKVALYAPRGVVGGITSWTDAVLGSELTDTFDFHVLNYAKHWQEITNTKLHWRTLYEAFARFFRLVQLLRAQRPVAFYGVTVIGKGMLRDILLARIAIAHGVPAALHIRSGNWGWLASCPIWLRPLVRWMARPIQFVTLTSRVPDSARWIFSSPFIALPNFISEEKALLAANSPRTYQKISRRLYCAGWMSHEKGTFDLLRVAEQLPECELVIQGPVTDADRARLIERGHALGLEKRLTILPPGKFSEVSVQLKDAAIFVMMSHSEGFPNVILEAMAHGCPIVATAVGAVPEMLDAEGTTECGCVVDVGDVGSAVRKVRAILQDEGLYARMSGNALYRCESLYSEPIFVARFAGILRGLVNDCGNRPQGAPQCGAR